MIKGNKWANRVESLERQAENAERVVDEKSEEVHGMGALYNDIQNEAISVKQLEQVKQKLLTSKMNYRRLKEENHENPSREWIYEQSMGQS